ncbi:MAG TPA: hypothetical protein VEV43_02815 [Actinomycetota bacterium]|nr:hypothetical protein [Actinomycetota bacterium]
MTYVVADGGRTRLVTADFYNYWADKPYATFWRTVRGRDVPVETIRLGPTTSIRPR